MKQQINLNFEFPEWAKYHAIDENGDFCVFETKPVLFLCPERNAPRGEIPAKQCFAKMSNVLLFWGGDRPPSLIDSLTHCTIWLRFVLASCLGQFWPSRKAPVIAHQ